MVCDADSEMNCKSMGTSTTRERARQIPLRDLCFLLLGGMFLIGFWTPLQTLVQVSFQSEQYSHILLIPFVSGYLLYKRRTTIFQNVKYRFDLGTIPLLAGAMVLYVVNWQSGSLSQNDSLSLTMIGLVTLGLGGFLCFYGVHAFREALFPLMFLFLMVPFPDFLLAKTIRLLQVGSAEATHWFFDLAGVPVFREELRFSLPGITIEIAKECSGIRSSLALIITSLLAGHLFLRSSGKKVVLSAVVFPLIIVKNGLRIFTLSSLAVYVDRAFLTGWLHKQGGIVFFALVVTILGAVLWVLQRSENKVEKESVGHKPLAIDDSAK